MSTDDTIDADIVLTVTGAGTSLRAMLTEADGTKTVWKSTVTGRTDWVTESISEPGLTTGTKFGHTPDGRVSRIVAAVPAGVNPNGCPTSGAMVKGCRALDITYATSTTATSSSPGDYTGQVASISAILWDPATSSMKTTTVADYAYDTAGRLLSVVDPRTNLGTTYTWDDTSTRLASIKQSGEAATHLTYGTAPVGDPFKAVTTVERENPAGVGSRVTTSRINYTVPVTGAGTGGAADPPKPPPPTAPLHPPPCGTTPTTPTTPPGPPPPKTDPPPQPGTSNPSAETSASP